MSAALTIAVAIPAWNEADLIGRCLDALARQVQPGPFVVLVLANNCTDDTATVARRARGFTIAVIEHEFPAAQRSAGHARGLAMARAAKLGEIILTTDADCVPDADWIRCHRAAFAGGADAVAGRVSADWEELRHHPPEALRIGALEWEYLGLIGEAEALFDPRPHDPAPRHAQRCGANLGITRAMLARIGGVPPVATGEDWALLAAVERADGRIRHARGPHVTASARVTGRAHNGMADALAARTRPDYRCDEQFAAADTMVQSWQARHAARLEWTRNDGPTTGLTTFGAAWASRQGHDPERLTAADLPAQIARMRELIAGKGTDHG